MTNYKLHLSKIINIFKISKILNFSCWSRLVAEMIQSTGDIGTQWILDLCNEIVKEGSIPED